MNEISDVVGRQAPSVRSLIQATAIAVVVAAIVLVTAVLPAEYGIDPTGMGARLGLTAMGEGADESDADQPNAPTDNGAAELSTLNAVWKRDLPFQTGELSLTLEPNEGAEIKALMAAGDRMMFSWHADGPVSFDMHGEELNAGKDDFTSYWKGRNETTGHGAFIAPFAGTHGWYWRNRGSAAVTVHVKTSGYYEKLFKP